MRFSKNEKLAFVAAAAAGAVLAIGEEFLKWKGIL